MIRSVILLFFLLMVGQYGKAQPGCSGALLVFLQGTSTGTPEGLVVKDVGNSGYSTLRNVVACAQDGDVITYDQPTVTLSLLTQPLDIDKSLTFMGLDINNRPEIMVDFATLGSNPGIRIMNNKTVVLKDIDLRESNNPGNNDLIRVQDTSMFKVTGKTVVSKD